MIGCDDINDRILKKYVLDNLFDIEDNNNLIEPEIIVDFSKDASGEMIIDVKYNDSLSKERKQLESKSNPYSNNILILFLDSVSRVSSLLQLKKTLSFFEKFIYYNGNSNTAFHYEYFHSF